MNNDFILIEDWAIVFNSDNDPCLSGKVQNHPRFEKDKFVRTSRIVVRNKKEKYIETYSGNKYKLGKVNEDYEKQYPNVLERIFNIIEEK